MMIERLLFVVVSFAVGVAIYRWWIARQLSIAIAQSTQEPLLAQVPAHKQVIVYFTTPTCAPCQLQQTPILNQLQQELGDRLHIIRVDATEDPAASSRWGVFSVPTTFVLDTTQRPSKVFNGVVSINALRQALQIKHQLRNS